MSDNSRAAYFQLAGAAVCWSVASSFVFYLNGQMGVFTQNTFRYLSASVFLFIIAFSVFRTKAIITSPRLLSLLALTALCGVGFQMLWVFALYRIKPGTAALVSEFGMVIHIVVLSFFYEEEKRIAKSRLFLASNTVMLVGVSLVILFNGKLSFDFNTGVLLILFSSLFWAFYTAVIKRVLREVNSIIAMAYVAFFIALFHAIPALVTGKIGEVTRLSWHVMWIMILSGIISIAMSHSLFYMALKRVGALISGNILLAMPVMTCVISYFLWDERLSAMQIAGGVLLLGGAWMTTKVQYTGKAEGPVGGPD